MNTKQINSNFITNIQIAIVKQLFNNNEITIEEFNYVIERLNKKLLQEMENKKNEINEIELICYKKRRKKYERDDLCFL